MKVKKGQVNYLSEVKKQELNICILLWGLTIASILLYCFVFHTFFNLVLPIILLWPTLKVTGPVLLKKKFQVMDDEIIASLEKAEEHMTVIYHPILTSRDKVLGFECIVISGNTVLGYSSYKDTDLEFATRFIRTVLIKRKVDSVNIKLFDQIKPFMDRVEGLENMLSIVPTQENEVERKIRAVILKQCL